MGRVAYVNGRYLPHRHATVHIEDRGYQFADGIYEVVTVSGGRFVDEIGHLERLDRSLRELDMAPPMSRPAMRVIMREVVRRNKVRDGIIYLQITRGVAPRDHAFPSTPTRPALVMTAKSMSMAGGAARAAEGIKAITAPDIRWDRCDIKSVALLPNCLAKQAAREAGAYEALLVDADGMITEGSSTNAWMVDEDGNLVTRKADNHILNGITRLALNALASRDGVRIVERGFSVDEAKRARELFITSSSSFVMPVVQLDDSVIGNGKPGSVASRLREIYGAYMTGENREAAAGVGV
ncbi:MAG: D-amino-acid transaminase [Minwuiales bacterium]|nr:D-amino-acid transaminase [Minwuiales bacterium]